LETPPPPPVSLGLVSVNVLIISRDSFNLKVRSAFGWSPKTSGLSTGGTISIYSLYLLISLFGLAGILYLNLSLVAVPDPS